MTLLHAECVFCCGFETAAFALSQFSLAMCHHMLKNTWHEQAFLDGGLKVLPQVVQHQPL